MSSNAGRVCLSLVVAVVLLAGCDRAEPLAEPAQVTEAGETVRAEQQISTVTRGRFPEHAASRAGLGDARVLWTRSSVPESVVVSAGVAYIVSAQPALYAVELETGRLLWRRELSSPVLDAPLVSRSSVYLAGVDGSVLEVATADGSLTHRAQFEAALYHSPVLLGDELFVTADSGELLGVLASPPGEAGSAHSWRSLFDGGTPALSLLADSEYLVVVGLNRSILIWNHQEDDSASRLVQLAYGLHGVRDAALQDGVLYLGGRGIEVYELASGELLGARYAEDMARSLQVSRVLVSPHGPLLLDLFGYLHLLNTESLELEFSLRLPAEPSSLLLLGSLALVGLDNGTVYAVELPGGQVLWELSDARTAVTGMHPVGSTELLLAYAAEGVRLYRGIDLSEVPEDAGPLNPERLVEGSHLVVVGPEAYETEFSPARSAVYDISAVGAGGEEFIIVLFDEFGREMGRNLGYQVDPHLTADLSSDRNYTLRFEPVMRGVGPVDVRIEISRR